MTASLTPVSIPAGWIVRCHRRTGCDNMAWLPKPPMPPGPIQLVVKAKLVGELPLLLPKGWVVTIWDFHQTRILGQTEECVGGRPHYFCSESCQQTGCNPTSDPLASFGDGDQPCMTWASSVEVSREVVEQIAAAAVKQERADVDALLAKRLEECFCTEVDGPCDDCVEVARIRGTLAGRNES